MKYLYFIVCLIITSHGWAQKQNVYFLKNDGRLVDTKDSADFIRIIREPDSGTVLYNVLEFYPKGQRKLLGKSSKIDPVMFDGVCISYYANGNRERVATYKNNYIIGAEYTFFPNGKPYTDKEFSMPDSTEKIKVTQPQTVLIKACYDSTGKSLVINGNGHFIGYSNGFKNIFEQGEIKDGKKTGEWKGNDQGGKLHFTEIYADGNLISGTSTDSSGTYNYHERVILPRYKGGVQAFYNYLGNTIIYPVPDRTNGTQGTVVLTFLVTRSGKVNRIKIMRKVSRTIDAEAVRVLNRSTGWLPEIAYGRQVDAYFTIPISFALSDH